MFIDNETSLSGVKSLTTFFSLYRRCENFVILSFRVQTHRRGLCSKQTSFWGTSVFSYTHQRIRSKNSNPVVRASIFVRESWKNQYLRRIVRNVWKIRATRKCYVRVVFFVACLSVRKHLYSFSVGGTRVEIDRRLSNDVVHQPSHMSKIKDCIVSSGRNTMSSIVTACRCAVHTYFNVFRGLLSIRRG